MYAIGHIYREPCPEPTQESCPVAVATLSYILSVLHLRGNRIGKRLNVVFEGSPGRTQAGAIVAERPAV